MSVKVKSALKSRPEWTDNFEPVKNKERHHFHREYFDKKPSEHAFNYRFFYPRYQTETAGIVSMHAKPPKRTARSAIQNQAQYRKVFKYHKVPLAHKMHKEALAVMRQPFTTHTTSQWESKSEFNSHYGRATGWNACTSMQKSFVRGDRKVLRVADHVPCPLVEQVSGEELSLKI